MNDKQTNYLVYLLTRYSIEARIVCKKHSDRNTLLNAFLSNKVIDVLDIQPVKYGECIICKEGKHNGL